METMKTRLLNHEDIKRVVLHEHDSGRQVVVIRLSNDLELRFPCDNGKATVSGFLWWGTDSQRYIDGPVTIVDGVGL